MTPTNLKAIEELLYFSENRPNSDLASVAMTIAAPAIRRLIDENKKMNEYLTKIRILTHSLPYHEMKEQYDENKLSHNSEDDFRHWQEMEPCPSCEGEGWILERTCKRCLGNGMIVKIPGKQMRMKRDNTK